MEELAITRMLRERVFRLEQHARDNEQLVEQTTSQAKELATLRQAYEDCESKAKAMQDELQFYINASSTAKDKEMQAVDSLKGKNEKLKEYEYQARSEKCCSFFSAFSFFVALFFRLLPFHVLLFFFADCNGRSWITLNDVRSFTDSKNAALLMS